MNKKLLGIVLLGSLCGSAAAQSNLGWLKDTPISKFSKSDIQTVKDTLNQALEKGEDGVPVTWENAAASNSGSVTPSADPKSRPGCRAVKIENRHQTLYNATDIVLCKTNGQWKRMPN